MQTLMDSTYNNDLAAVKRIIATGADVNVVDRYGRTALWHAATGGHVECATALIDAKADVNKAENSWVRTPLHQASMRGRVECVRLLIKHKANVNTLDNFGISPLYIATGKGDLACVQILVAAGASREIDRHDNNGNTPLVCAIGNDHPNIAEFLLHSGAKMKNVPPHIVRIPDWMINIIQKRYTVMNFTLVLIGALKMRCGLSKDATHLVALYVWSRRLKFHL